MSKLIVILGITGVQVRSQPPEMYFDIDWLISCLGLISFNRGALLRTHTAKPTIGGFAA